MNFWQQAAATFIGALSGFIFSIALFYVTEKVKQHSYADNLEKNLQKELDFNLSLLETIKDEIDELLRKITANDAQHIFTIFKYEQLQKNFLQQAFWNGTLYNKLTPEKVYKVQEMWNFFTFDTTQFDMNNVATFQRGQNSQLDTLSRFEFVKKTVGDYIKFNKELKTKLARLSERD